MTALATPPKLQFLDANGAPLVGGKLYTYAAGTTTPQVTYTDFGGGTANANPVILDSRGEANVWLGTALYKMALYSATDVLIWTVDNIGGFATLAQLAASGGSALVGYLPAGTGAVATTVQAELRTVMLANNFGADATGTTDTTTQLQLAIAALNTAGTGTLIFDGQYNLGTNTSGTIEKFRITASNATLIFRNGTKFTCTSDNHLVQLFVLAGVSNVNFEGVLSAESAVTNTYTTTGTTGIRVVSIENDAAGNSGNIHIEAIRLVRGAAAVVVGNAYTSNNRVQGIYIGDIYTKDVTYGINCANNGDTVRCNNLTTDTAFRSWFAYGCKDHSGNISSLNHYASGTVINLSRYSTAEGGSSTNTEGYNLSVKVIDAGNNVTIASLRHLGDGGATQKIQGIYLNISSNVLSTGLTALSMLNFASAGGAITATTFSAVMTNIRVDISTPDNSNAIYVDVSNWAVRPVVTFSGSSGVPFASIRALASVVNLQVVTGTAISDGVFESGTFTPTIVGTTLAGVGTYTTQVGSYTKIGNRVLFNVALDWSAHTGTGNMRMAGLPFTSNALANNISAVSLVSSNIALTASNVLSGAIAPANTQVIFYQTPVGGGTVNTVPIDTAGLVYVSGHYNI